MFDVRPNRFHEHFTDFLGTKLDTLGHNLNYYYFATALQIDSKMAVIAVFFTKIVNKTNKGQLVNCSFPVEILHFRV